MRNTRRRDWGLIVPAAVLGSCVLIAIGVHLFSTFDPLHARPAERLLPPGSRLTDGTLALLGTDGEGRSILTLVIEGTRVSMTVGLATILIAGSIGTAVGVVAAFWGRWSDALFMRVADVQLAFPSLLLAVFISAMLGSSVMNVIIVLAFTRWVVFARVARAQTLAVREREFVEGTRTLGAGSLHILRSCILPATLSPLLVVAALELGLVIIAEASLSFLGLGTPPTTPSWGTTIALGRNHIGSAWWISAFPGMLLTLIVVSAGSLGDRLRDRLDPYLRGMVKL